ncbi:hypothetical protein, partial [Methylobacterium gnaphalii]|uniref:hypothetical protein n=1 Tax=Methylobacterium gnaphalii TaxID=1010610 RepID=UPI0024E0CB88
MARRKADPAEHTPNMTAVLTRDHIHARSLGPAMISGAGPRGVGTIGPRGPRCGCRGSGGRRTARPASA